MPSMTTCTATDTPPAYRPQVKQISPNRFQQETARQSPCDSPTSGGLSLALPVVRDEDSWRGIHTHHPLSHEPGQPRRGASLHCTRVPGSFPEASWCGGSPVAVGSAQKRSSGGTSEAEIEPSRSRVVRHSPVHISRAIPTIPPDRWANATRARKT